MSCSFLCAVCVTGLAPCGVFSFCHARCCDVRSSQLKLKLTRVEQALQGFATFVVFIVAAWHHAFILVGDHDKGGVG